MSSPFPYDKLPDAEQFFGRDREIAAFDKSVAYSNNLLLYSKRRMGKSSLIKNFFDRKQKEYLCVYVDIFDITSKESFAYELLEAISNSKKQDIKSSIKKLTSIFKRVRVEPTIDPHTLEYSIKPVVTTLSFEEMMDDFFHSVAELSKKQRLVIAIDEFQQIATLGEVRLDALLRKHIQERGNVSYIFSGSKRHLLTSLFEYKAPLYEMATHFGLPPLSIDAVFEYSKKHLPITKEVCEEIYEISDAETKMMQQILHLLYMQRENSISKEMVKDAVDEIVNSKDSSYRLLYDTLANNQKLALKIVSRYKSGFFANEVLSKYNLKKQTLQSSVEALFKKELIDKEGGKYFIPDRTFELWVERL